jgi:hypothetical protein
MEALYKNLVWIHIVGGFGGLLLLWVPLFTAKGGRVHRKMGWIYVVCMSVAVFSAFGMVGLVLADPLAVKPLRTEHPPEVVARIAASYRTFAAFLGMLALLTFMAGYNGLKVLRNKKTPERMKTPFNVGLMAATALVGGLVTALGLTEQTWLLAIVGPVGLFAGISSLYSLYRPPKLKMAWWYDHLGGMMGTGIAAYTAFTVFGAQRLMPDLARTALFPVVWIVPILGGIIASEWLTRHYKRKFGDLPTRAAAPSAKSAASGREEKSV